MRLAIYNGGFQPSSRYIRLMCYRIYRALHLMKGFAIRHILTAGRCLLARYVSRRQRFVEEYGREAIGRHHIARSYAETTKIFGGPF